MKNIAIGLLTALLMASGCARPLQAQSRQMKSLQTAVASWNQALVSPPALDTLSQLTHDSVSYGHSGGLVEGKEAFLRKLSDGHSVFLNIKTANDSYRIIGRTAVVRHQLLADTHDQGKPPVSIKLAVLQVWVRERAGWKLLARQAVKQ